MSAPRAAARAATARPMPDVPPMTTTFLPLSSNARPLPFARECPTWRHRAGRRGAAASGSQGTLELVRRPDPTVEHARVDVVRRDRVAVLGPLHPRPLD